MKKILIANEAPTAHFFIRMGLARAFSALGHKCIVWDMQRKPAFDAVDELQPDLLFIPTYLIDDTIIKIIQQYPKMQVIGKTSDWGTISDTLDREKYPVLIANDREKEYVQKLKDLTGKPDFGYVHYLQDRIEATHNHWFIPVKSLISAADIFAYSGGEYKPHYESDITFVGGRWGYKSRTFDKWFIPLLDRNKYPNLNIKIFGNQPWGVPQYCGFLPDSEVKDALASAKVCVNLSEPHSQDFGYDVVERPYKLLGNGCFTISDYVEDMEEIFDNHIPLCNTPESFWDEIMYRLDQPEEELKELAEAGKEHVFKYHTYLDRVMDLFLHLGWTDEYQQGEESIQEIKQKLL